MLNEVFKNAVAKLAAVAVGALPVLSANAGTIPASAYAQRDHLLLQWDGIENAGAGLPHDSSLIVWKDLSGKGNDGNLKSMGSFGDDGLDMTMTGSDRWAVVTKNELSGVKTIECRVKITGGDSGTTGALIGGSSTFAQAPVPNVRVHFTVNPWCLGFDTSDAGKWHSPVKSGDICQFAYCSEDGSTYTAYWEGESTGKSCVYSPTTVRLAFGGMWDNPRRVTGTIYAVRLYDCALSPAELALNAVIDKARYTGAFPEGYRYNAETGKIAVRVSASCEAGMGTIALNGGASGVVCEEWVPFGSRVTISAVPAADRFLDRWTGQTPEKIADGQYALTANGPVSLAPVFSRSISAETSALGLWLFAGQPNEQFAIGTKFSNRINSDKFPAEVRARYDGAASSEHLSFAGSYETDPFNAIRQTKFGLDCPIDNSVLCLDGGNGANTGCPVYIDDTSSGELSLQTFTVEMVMKMNSSVAQNWRMFFNRIYQRKTSSGVQSNFSLYSGDNKNMTVNYVCADATSGTGMTTGTKPFGAVTLNDGNWHHLALSVDGSTHEMKLYIDRVQHGSTQTLPGDLLFTPAEPWVFGNSNEFNGYGWDGSIAAIRLSPEALEPSAMLHPGVAIDAKAAICYMKLDGDFRAEGWSGVQPSEGEYAAKIAESLASGKISFADNGFPHVRKGVEGLEGSYVASTNVLKQNGGSVDLGVSQFRPSWFYDGLTLEFFMKQSNADFGSDWVNILDCRSAANGICLALQYGGSGTKFYCRCDNTAAGVSKTATISTPNVYDGRWHHVAVVFAPTQTDYSDYNMKVYIDYGADPCATLTGLGANPFAAWKYLRLGKLNSALSVAALDEVRLSRGVLEPAEFLRVRNGKGLIIVVE